MSKPTLNLVFRDPPGDAGPQDQAPPEAVRGPQWPPPTAAGTPAKNEAAGTATSDATEAPGTAKTAATTPGGEAAEIAPPTAELELWGQGMTFGQKARRVAAGLAAHWWAQHRKEATRHGGLLHAVYHGRGHSIADVHEYALSRSWVPDGHKGKFLPRAGALYAHTVAKGGVALALAFIWVVVRPLRAVVVTLACSVAVTIILIFS